MYLQYCSSVSCALNAILVVIKDLKSGDLAIVLLFYQILLSQFLIYDGFSYAFISI